MLEIRACDSNRLSMLAHDSRGDQIVAERDTERGDVHERQQNHRPERYRQRGDRRAGERKCAETDRGCRTGNDRGAVLESAAKNRSVPPGGEFGPERLADANELCSVAQPRESDIVRLGAEFLRAEQALTLFDRLPSLVERREIPPAACDAHDPEAAVVRIERETPADRERLDAVVLAERVMAMEARGVHCITRCASGHRHGSTDARLTIRGRPGRFASMKRSRH